MKLIVGLGNIGKSYQNTRHNLGFMCLDYLASKEHLEFKEEKKLKCLLTSINRAGEKIILIKPTTYMNLSGEAVRAVMDFYKISLADIIVICDDLDSPVGRVRLRAEGSSGGHNGLKNIILHCHSELFKRIKIGIARDKDVKVVDYVLQEFKEEEKTLIQEAIFNVASALEEFMADVPFAKIASKYSKK